MDAAPLWTDIKTFPCEGFRGKVDILVAGYPCQPFSAAGKRQGENDPRHLWPYIRDSIRVIQPRLCFFENVEGHISLGLSSVISDLEELGYKVSWGIFSASEVGAPHQRKRVFILAHLSSERLERHGAVGVEELHESHSEKFFACGNSENVWPSRPGEPQHAWEPPRVTTGLAHTGSIGRRGRSDGDAGGLCGEIQTAGSCCSGAEKAMGNADHGRLASGLNAGSGAEADRGGEGDIEQADGGAMGNPTSEGSQERSPRFNDSSIQAAQCGSGSKGDREAQPSLGRDADGPAGGVDYAELCVSCDNRTDELRLLGNGVVPATAERAFRTLLAELK